MNVLAATGTVTLLRRYFWSRALGGLCPVDARVGIQDRTVTVGARRILCTLGVIHDFKQAAEDLYAVAGIRVSPERLRQIVESQGRRVMEARLSGVLDPGWSASQADRVYVGADAPLGCRFADFNADDSVDLTDFAAFQIVFTDGESRRATLGHKRRVPLGRGDSVSSAPAA